MTRKEKLTRLRDGWAFVKEQQPATAARIGAYALYEIGKQQDD